MQTIPYKDLSVVDILMFDEYPSTVVYSDRDTKAVIVEWIDVENEIDQYFIYEVPHSDLEKFLNYKISHFDIVQLAVGGEVLFFEGMLEDPKNMHLMKIADINEDHLPGKNIIDLLNVHKIANHFKLKI